jgi:hypothetical protein
MACSKKCKTTAKYTLVTDKRAYFSNSLFGLFLEMAKNKFGHLRRKTEWMD